MQHQAVKLRWEASEKHRYLLALALGLVIFFWTDDPLPAVLLSSLQAGWGSLFAGWWLWRLDANRRRARTCLLFQLATAAWQVAAAALVSVLFMMFASASIGKEPDLNKFAATVVALAVGVALSTAVGLIAVLQAISYRIRVWSHPRLISEWEERGIRQPIPYAKRFNYAIFVAGTSLVTPVILLGIALLMVTTVRTDPDDVALIPAVVAFVTVFGGPLAMILVYAWISQRIIARHPWECWPSGLQR